MRKITIMSGDVRYAFSSGRIRSLEQKLITKAVAAKLVESDLEDFSRILFDYGYAFPSEIKSESELNKVFSDELGRLLELIEFLSVDKEFPLLLRKRYDFLNIAYLLKSRINNVEFEPIPYGTIKPSELRYLFDAEKWEKLPEELYDGIVLGRKAYEETELLSSIDSRLEWRYFKYLMGWAKKVEFIKGYYELYFEIENIMSFARCRAFGKPFKHFAFLYLDCGRCDLNFYRDIYDLPVEQVVSILSETEFGKPIGESFHSALHSQDFNHLQKFKDKILLEYLEQTRYCPFGIELLFSYYKRKEREIGVVKAIAYGRFWNLPANTIKAALPYGYE